MIAGELCSRTVVFADRGMRLTEAARLMREHHVGSLVVAEQAAKGPVPVGMVTDRDITVAVVAKEVDARTTTVEEIMGPELVTVREQDRVLDALRLMRSHGVRRIPVIATDGTIAGILALDDVLEAVAGELAEIAHTIAAARERESRVRRA
jgi:CBS domain-containing protein